MRNREWNALETRGGEKAAFITLLQVTGEQLGLQSSAKGLSPATVTPPPAARTGCTTHPPKHDIPNSNVSPAVLLHLGVSYSRAHQSPCRSQEGSAANNLT